MNASIKNEFNETMTAFITAFSSADEELTNVIPFEGSWTAGQLAQHIILSGNGFAGLLKSAGSDAERSPDEKIPGFKEPLLNFDLKLNSPDFICPEEKEYNKKEELESLNQIVSEINAALDISDLSKLHAEFDMPVLGHLTGLEAIYFLIYHTQRHTRQMQKIADSLVATA